MRFQARIAVLALVFFLASVSRRRSPCLLGLPSASLVEHGGAPCGGLETEKYYRLSRRSGFHSRLHDEIDHRPPFARTSAPTIDSNRCFLDKANNLYVRRVLATPFGFGGVSLIVAGLRKSGLPKVNGIF